MSSDILSNYLVIGRITKAHGLDGTVSVYPLTDNPQRFKQLKECFLLDYQSGKKPLAVQRVSVSGTRVLLKFADLDGRNIAEQLRDQHIYVSRDQAIELPDDNWFICDLVGCIVHDERRGNLGSISDVLVNGPQSTLVIGKEGDRDILLPFNKNFVPVVDIEQRYISVKLPPGLFEIYRG